MALLDSTENFHLFDVRNQEALESIDLSNVQLVYGSSFFKGLATGGNVSAAMALAGEKATYESFLTFTNQFILLGRNTFHVMMIRSWSERIDYLVKANNYLDCLTLGSEFYCDQGKALVGLRGPREKRRALIANKMVAVLLKYLDVCMTKNFPQEGNMSVLKEYFATTVPPCVNLCMTLKRKDILFENVWNAFQIDPFGKATYLECLESYILSDQLRNLPVNISQEFVEHYERTECFMALEACITHLNVVCLDIHQVMSSCWQYGLYDAIIYIYNNGMQDFVTPAEELLTVLVNALKSNENGGYESVTKRMTSSQIKLGNKLLVYISCCLAGRAYPYGDIANDQVAKVKYEVYSCLTALHTKMAKDDELVYPYLRTLLSFDTQGLLNVLSIAFEEQEFKTDLGKCQKQRLVDILLQIMVHESSAESSSFSPSQVAYLFTFLAQQIAKEDHGALTVSRGLFEQVLDVLTDTREKSHTEERQQALLDMLNAGGQEYFDKDHLIFRAQKVGFYRILEMLHDKGKEYVKLLRTYIDDPYRQGQVFTFLQKVFLEDNDDKKGQVEKSVLDDLDALISIDCKKTAIIIYFHMYPYIPLVLARLEPKKATLYEFLMHLLEHKEGGSQPSTPVHRQVDDPLTTPETYEGFIELMCQLEPKGVASYLKSKGHLFRPEVVLRIVSRYGIKDATAYLLEQDGKLVEAFDLMRSDLDSQICDITNTKGDADKAALLWSKLNASVVMVIQLCQRSSLVLQVGERDQMWLLLLDSLMKPQNDLKGSQSDELKPFKEVVRHVVTSALGHISLRSVVDRILRDPMYRSDNFGDVQDFLKEMLEMYHYEETLIKSTTQSVHFDIHAQQLKLQAVKRKGFAVNSVGCDLCAQHLAKASGKAVVFQCGHKYHCNCLANAGCLRQVFDKGEELWLCYTCLKHQAIEDNCDDNVIVANTHEDGDRDDDDQPPDELVKEITNQQVVKAHAYVKRLKERSSYDENNSKSIFDSDCFKLNLSNKPPVEE